jgi:hypothetical protein
MMKRLATLSLGHRDEGNGLQRVMWGAASGTGLGLQHAWRQPILRLFDTLIGIAIGITAVWIGRGLHKLSHFSVTTLRSETSQLKIKKETVP